MNPSELFEGSLRKTFDEAVAPKSRNELVEEIVREFDENWGKNSIVYFDGKATYSHRHESIKAFLSAKLTEAYQRGLEKARECVPAGRKMERTEDLENDWYANEGWNDCRTATLAALDDSKVADNQQTVDKSGGR